MLSRLRDVVTRHRKKFIVAGVLVGGTYIAIKYAQKKFIEMQERHAREFLEKSRRMQHFESTENICNQLIIGMGNELMLAILNECNTDELLQQLRDDPSNKTQLWEEMKIISLTRLTTFIYASSMLVVSLRIQLNLLGGYLYRDSITVFEQENSKTSKQLKINENLQPQYLLLIRHFINDGGLPDLVRFIRSKVNDVVKELPLTKDMNLADMEQLFWSLQMSINSDADSDPSSKLCKYMLPSQLSNFTQTIPLLQEMFNETMDLLESDDASSVCSHNICRGFSLATDIIAESMTESLLLAKKSTNKQETKNNKSEITSSIDSLLDINSIQMTLAKIVPIITGLTAKGFDRNTRPQNLATSLITFYVLSEKCKLLGANVYETFSSA